MVERKFRVAICGGGIGGLTCAVALSQYPDIDVDIYEAAHKFTELGAGIGIWPRPWKILKALGLEPALYKVTDSHPKEGSSVPVFNYRKSDQPEGVEFYTLLTREGLRTFHRPAFQQVLLASLPPSYTTNCSKRLRSYNRLSSGKIQLVFEDGSTGLCDVLIGADGIKSSVRASLLREKAKAAVGVKEKEAYLSAVDPCWSGTIAYRAIIPAEQLQLHAPDHRVSKKQMQYIGKNGFILAYPIAQGKLINFFAAHARHALENTPYQGNPVSAADKEEFVSAFSHWEPEVRELLSVVENPTKWAILTVKPLRSFVGGRVALIGDAAHGMTPYQGAGAGQSIEDAYILATLLGHPRTTLDTLPRALEIYDSIRQPFANKVAERSRVNGHYFTLRDIDCDSLTGDAQMNKLCRLAEAFTKNWEWCWATTIDGSVREAIRMLESS